MNERSVTRTGAGGVQVQPLQLLETLRWTPQEGYFLLDLHLARLVRSGSVLGFEVDLAKVEEALARATAAGQVAMRVRALLGRRGEVQVEASVLSIPEVPPIWRIGMAGGPVDASDPRLQHKTTDREPYERARAMRGDLDDVILFNGRGEVTEATVANIVVERKGERVTPPLGCGLLAGTFRAYLIARGEVREEVITRDALRKADAIWLINSVREWMPARLEAGDDAGG
ncbi:MAG: aminotransferase class IV [Verrucomicrobia bacterium]|nr:aminotransferase class IV [Verrucomicrobiota bacterium]